MIDRQMVLLHHKGLDRGDADGDVADFRQFAARRASCFFTEHQQNFTVFYTIAIPLDKFRFLLYNRSGIYTAGENRPMPKAILPSDIWVDRKRNMTVTEKTVAQTTKFHMHEYFEIELILDGGGTQNLNGDTFPFEKECLYLLSPHRFSCGYAATCAVAHQRQLFRERNFAAVVG